MKDVSINFHGEDVIPSLPEDALFHIIPAPLEKSVSYGTGTAKGPEAILRASAQLELFACRNVPAEYGIYTAKPVDCSGTVSVGLANIALAVGNCLIHESIPIVIGGEHTVTLGALEAIADRHDAFGVIQFDAHADLREEYEGSPLSHACVMKRVFDQNIPVLQIGTRSYSRDEHLFRQEHNISYFDAEDIFKKGIECVQLPADFPDRIYITFDIDVFDPSLIPATGTPVPGGLSWYQAMWLIERLVESRVCIGFDVVEFAPMPAHHSSSFTAAQLVYNMMGYLTRSELNKNHRRLDGYPASTRLKKG